MNIGIAGLGLIGGSLAKAIKTKTFHTVFGFDISKTTVDNAMDSGAIDAVLDQTALSNCEMLIVALYPNDAVAYIRAHAQGIGANTVVVDCCGIKRFVCDRVKPISDDCRFAFVGGHPMAGTERSGFEAARADLFSGASMIVTPDETTPQWAMERIADVFLSIGFARLQYSTAEEHDRVIALTSQLAHVISCAYVEAKSARMALGYSAGSFRDMTRVAYLNETMWSELFLKNADFLAEEIEELIGRLSNFAQVLREQDEMSMLGLLKKSRETKEIINETWSKGKSQ